MRKLFLTLLILSVCGEVHAFEAPLQCPEKPKGEDSRLALASTWFEIAQKHVATKEYPEAVNAFLCSLHMVEHPATLYNAGKAALMAQRYDLALEMGQRILAKTTDEKAKREAQELIAQAKSAVPQKDFKDGPARIPEKVEKGGVTEPKIDQLPSAETQSSSLRRSSLWKVGLTSTAVGGATVVIGAVLQGLAGSAANTTEKTRDYARYARAKKDIAKFQPVATATFIVGGVLAGVGITLVLIDGKKEEAVVKVTAAWNGIALMGDF